ncbi:MAG: type I pullulanase [Acutalibacteraceae bacterium]
MKLRKIIAGILGAMMVTSTAAASASAVTTNEETTGAYFNQAESYNTYSGGDLGATYSKESSTFKVWAPSASKVQLKRYQTGSDTENGAGVIETRDMTMDSATGTWSVTVDGDLNGTYYTYLVTANGTTKETQDVYSVATGVNGNRSMVVDLSKTNPDGWENDKHMLVDNQTDAVIWEVQVRDFSISKTSGVSEANRGKYLAFTESGTKVNGTDDISTCVDYLVKQGVNYVHLNPVYDYGSVDETKLDIPQYNWGYDPVNYNVPDGSYSSNPYKGEVRIKEFKQMVQALHDRGIGVIMDVVYNHTFSTDSCFQKTVPGYYYRMKTATTFLNGSGCGNVTASDKTMFRKYMIDSVTYWANEYHIDGFRFDLMGCHDITTMNQIRAALDKIDKRILIYGEPWMADWGANGISQTDACIINNASKINERVAMFSDKMRNALKGGTDDATKGYIQGSTTVTSDIKSGMMGGSSTTFGKWAKQPSQCITYNSAHDNLTLWDKILKSNGSSSYNSTSETFLAQNKLSAAIVLTSQGVPFYLAGEEFARTKNGNHNSYNSADSVNQINWSRVKTYSNLVEYYKGLMKIRASYSPFRDGTTASGNTTYFAENGSAIGYTIQNKTANAANEWGTVAVLTNNTTSAKSLTLKSQGTLPSSWVIVANGTSAGVKSLGTISGSTVSVPARTAMILVDEASFNRVSIPQDEYRTVTVNHVDKATNEVIKTTESLYKVGTTYRTQADSDVLFDYKLDSIQGKADGTVTDDVTVTYYYTSDGIPSYMLTVQYVNQSGKVLKAEKTTKMKQGTSYSEPHEFITGYELDTTKLPTNAFGTITADTTVKYVYKQIVSGKVKIHYYNSKGWNPPYVYAYTDAGSNLTGAWPGKAMTADPDTGNKWYTYAELSATQANVMFTNGAKTNTVQEPGANMPGYPARGEVWIQNGTTAFNTEVIVSHINKNGEKLTDDVIVEGNKVKSTSRYVTKPLAGYDTPTVLGNPNGYWTQGVTNVIYVYNTSEKPTVPPTDPTAPPTIPGDRYMLGDADMNGEVTVRDVLKIQEDLAKIHVLTGVNKTAADVNANGSLEMGDILEIQKYLAKIKSAYKVGEYFGAEAPTEIPTQKPTEAPTATPTDPPTEPPTTPQAGTINVYFSSKWSNVNAYIWNNATEDKPAEWPGVAINGIKTNDYGETIYEASVDLSKYDRIVFNGSGGQTVDIELDETSDGTGYYITEQQNTLGHYEVGTYLYSET